MRGGVSLAVWIGGACAEIETLRLAGVSPPDGDAPGSSFYRRLLQTTGFDGVQVDVLAGASAGGLNGALLASSLVYGTDFSACRDVWLEVAGLRDLLRPGTSGTDAAQNNRRREATSLLDGTHFLKKLEEHLHKQLQTRDTARPASGYVDLHLTATAAAARPVAVTDDAAAWYLEGTHRAGFRFRHNRHTSDFQPAPDGPDGDRDEQVARGVASKLALAARASASFPGAFEPTRVPVRRPDRVGQRAHPRQHDNLFGVFSDPSQTVAWVIDGGLLDNIPLARAIQSIAEAPADRVTERWLLYLSPSPDDQPADTGRAPTWSGPGAPHLFWTLKAVQRAQSSRESALDDMAALRAHNALAAHYAAARNLLISSIQPNTDAEVHDALLASAARSVAAYRRDRAARDAGRARALLEDPVAALGEDPFPDGYAWPLRYDGSDGWTHPLRNELEEKLRQAFLTALDDPDDPEEGKGLRDAFLDVHTPPTPTQAAVLGPAPVGRAARYLIGEIATLEHHVGEVVRDELDRNKQALYNLADAADLLAHMGQLFWPVYWRTAPPPHDHETKPDPSTLADWATKAVGEHTDFLRTAGVAAEESVVGEQFTVLRHELRRRLESADTAGSWAASNLVAWLWARLATLVERLADTLTSDPAIGGDVDLSDADPGLGALAAVLRAVAEGQANCLQSLVALEIVTAPLDRLSPLPPQPIRFARLSGANPTQLDMPQLFPGGKMDVTRKLCGNQLLNFAAFYKRSWRANDWMWGRLDAVDTLLQVLLQPDELARRLKSGGESSANRFVEQLKAIVTADFPTGHTLDSRDHDEWKQHVARLWTDEVATEIAALQTDRRGDLPLTRRVLAARRQWEIVVEELPAVLTAVSEDEREAAGMARWSRRRTARRSNQPPTELRTPADFQAELDSYTIGIETIRDDLGSDHFTRLAAHAAVGAWKAVRHAVRHAHGAKKWFVLPDVAFPVGRWLLVNVPPLRRLCGLAARRAKIPESSTRTGTNS